MMDMELFEMKGCLFQGGKHSHGSELCVEEKCMICNNEMWEDMVELFPPKVFRRPMELELECPK